MRISDWSSDVCSSDLHPVSTARRCLFCGIFRGSGTATQRKRAMTAARYNVRVPAALDQALHKVAEQEGLTAYALLQRIVKAGIAARTKPRAADAEARELIAGVASLAVRLADIEQIGRAPV